MPPNHVWPRAALPEWGPAGCRTARHTGRWLGRVTRQSDGPTVHRQPLSRGGTATPGLSSSDIIYPIIDESVR